MNKTAVLIPLLLLAVAVPILRSQAGGSAWTAGAELDFNSRYLWRALVLNDRPVFQPSAWIGRAAWTFSAWSNFVLGKEPNRHQFNEVDLRLSYKTELGPFEIEPAVNIYSYPNQDRADNPTTGEIEVAIALPVGPFSLETAHFLDFWDNRGGYIGEVGIEYESEPTPGLTVAAAGRLLFANAAFNSYYVPLERSALNALALEAGLTLRLSEALTIRPHLEWNRLLDAGLREAVAGSSYVAAGRTSVLNLGIAFAWEFSR